MKGKYVGGEEAPTCFASGVSIATNGDKTVLTFFNELPALPSEYEISFDGNGNPLSVADLPGEYSSMRKVVCSIQMDNVALENVISFIRDNLVAIGQNHDK